MCSVTSNFANITPSFAMRFAAVLLILSPMVTRADAPKVTFDDQVAPVLRQHCQGCHNNDKQRGGLNLATYNALKMGGSSGDVVTAGDPDKSRLYTMTAHVEEPKMPPSGTKIPDAQLAILKTWIELGAAENKGSKVSVSTKPKADLSLKTVARGKPDGPPPMPTNLPLDPAVVTSRPGAIVALAASPWAPLIAVGGQKQIALFHTDGNYLGVMPFDGQINSLKFSRNGQFLLAAGGRGGLSGKAILYEVATGKKITEVGKAETDAVLCADLSADQTTIAVGTTSRLVRIYQVSNGEVLYTIKKHTDWVTAIEYSPDGVLLASADRNGGIFIWEAETAREFYTLRGPTESVNDLSWRADSNLLVTASLDGTARLWEMQDGREVKKWNAHSGTESARFLPDGRIATTGRDKLTKLWDVSGKQLSQFPPMPDIALQVVAGHDNNRIVTGDWSGTLQVWSIDGKPVATLDANPAPVAEQVKATEADVAKRQAALTQLENATKAAEMALRDKNDAISRLEVDLKRLTLEQQANTKILGDADAQLKKLSADELAYQAAIAKSTAALQASEAKLEARTATANAYALAETSLRAAVAKSPNNAELKADLNDAVKLTAGHKTELEAVQKARAASESIRGDSQTKLAALAKPFGDVRATFAASQKKVGELAATVKSLTEALPGAKSARDAMQKALGESQAVEKSATTQLAAARAKLTQLQAAMAVQK